jgi:hypothetical protein
MSLKHIWNSLQAYKVNFLLARVINNSGHQSRNTDRLPIQQICIALTSRQYEQISSPKSD